jgi:hypothetical protein
MRDMEYQTKRKNVGVCQLLPPYASITPNTGTNDLNMTFFTSSYVFNRLFREAIGASSIFKTIRSAASLGRTRNVANLRIETWGKIHRYSRQSVKFIDIQDNTLFFSASGCHGDNWHRYWPIICTEEYVYSEGLVRLVQSYNRLWIFPRDRRTDRPDLEKKNLYGHVTNSQNWFDMKNLKTHLKRRAFRYQISENTCLEKRFCTGSGRRTSDLKFVKNSYGFVGPSVEKEHKFTMCVSWILLWLGRKTSPPRGVKQWHYGPISPVSSQTY